MYYFIQYVYILYELYVYILYDKKLLNIESHLG